MKVLAIIFLVVGVVSAGSGPYLPSGWKPSGPAFLLPSEVQKPSENPLKETLQVEAEGSDFLREYGPPKLQEQALPSVSTEQAFAAIDLRTNEIAKTDVEDATVTENAEVKAAVENQETATDVARTAEVVELTTETVAKSVESGAKVDETAVEIAVDGEPVVETESENVVQGRAFTETDAEGTTVAYEETEALVTESTLEEATDRVEAGGNANGGVSAVEEKEDVALQAAEREGKSVEAEVKESNEGVKNIAEALVELEKEIKSQQVQEVVEVRTGVENTGSAVQNVPEGFLEYGPPGFTEYGPPKLLRSANNVEHVAEESNETRRRRFSPKFRTARRTHQ